MEVSGQLHALATSLPGWVGSRASLNVMTNRGNPCPCQELNPQLSSL